MTQCVEIDNLKLDQESIAALERIKRKPAFGHAITALASAGVMSSIFTKSNAPTAAFNVTQTDFNLYTQAMQSIPKITKAAIEKDIDLMITHYQLYYDRNLLQFWKNLSYGCQQ